jgi:hypothetical protein
VRFEWIWPAERASAVAGLPTAVEVRDGHVSAHVSLIPLFITAD